MRVGVTGHQDIPPTARRTVRRRMAREVAALGSEVVGLSALAAGADQLFATLVLEAGGRLQVVVPCDDYEQTFTRPSDLARYRTLLARASGRPVKLKFHGPSKAAFLAAGRLIVERSDLLIAAWDGKEARGKGGTG